MDGVTVLTTTGGRDECFSLLVRCMEKQTYSGPIQWIAVYDIVSNVSAMSSRFIKNDLIEFEGVFNENTKTRDKNEPQFALNYLSIINRIKYDKIVIAEDDDWYHPCYLERMCACLDRGDVCGNPISCHYHVVHRLWHEWLCDGYCSLFHTGFNRSYLDNFREECEKGADLLDMRFWRSCRLDNSDGGRRLIFDKFRSSIGIKGMPGRAGLGMGHAAYGYTPDPDLLILRKWIGDDADDYVKFWDGF